MKTIQISDELYQLLKENMPPTPWSSSIQKGTPGHCFQAQVWDKDGNSLACIEPTENPITASIVARFIAEIRNALDRG